MISQRSFEAVTGLFHSVSGIRLGEAKRQLVTGRLHKLAQEGGHADVDDYVRQLMSRGTPGELVRVVDQLTTNETYFFREPQHFARLEALVRERRPGRGDLRVWSAASSSGEEAYSIAMVLADALGTRGWEVLGTDLSTAMVAAARRALYPLSRARHIEPPRLKRWCLKGQGDYEGTLLVARALRERVRFEEANLMQPLPAIGPFDVVFLRNVLIYFDNAAKCDIVRRVLERLAPGGLLFTGHAESLSQLGLPVRQIDSAVYAAA